jgi:hypothetical protein
MCFAAAIVQGTGRRFLEGMLHRQYFRCAHRWNEKLDSPRSFFRSTSGVKTHQTIVANSETVCCRFSLILRLEELTLPTTRLEISGAIHSFHLLVCLSHTGLRFQRLPIADQYYILLKLLLLCRNEPTGKEIITPL